MITTRILQLIAAGAAGAATGLAASMLRVRRTTPEERERRRRLLVNREGRTGNAMVTDFQDGVLSYSYEIRGTQYLASQDVSALVEWLPDEPSALISRPAIMKYLPENPANSIVICEDWSGLLFHPQAACSPEAP